MKIEAQVVKQLREKTGSGMMDCKKALLECENNFEAAVEWLKKKGLAAAAKKSGRTAAEGLVAAKVKPGLGVLIELNAETDFVARNDVFQNFINDILDIALSKQMSLEEFLACKMKTSTVQEELTHLIAVIGENLQLRRISYLAADTVSAYTHNNVQPGMGKIAVLVGFNAKGDSVSDLGQKLAMHVAAANPGSLTVAELDPETIEAERQVLMAQAKESGRPDNVVAQMVEGRIKKFYQEVVFLEQDFALDGKTKIKDMIEDAAKSNGGKIDITGFVRYQLGEGIEKVKENFAEEVSKQLQ